MPGHVPTYHLSCATINASLALVVEPLSCSGEPDQSAGQLGSEGLGRLFAMNCLAFQTRRP